MKNLFVYLLWVTLGVITLASCEKSENDVKPITENVSGEVSGVWSKGNTYVVKNHLLIPAGKSLTIEEGVSVIFSDSVVKPEVIVRGNLYILGTENNLVKLTVPDSWKTTANKFGNLWGGLVCASTCEELLIQYAILEYGGATTTEESPSVKAGLYKGAAGEKVPGINFVNENGKFVIQHSRMNNFQDDQIYIEGGKVIVSNNLIYTSGNAGGDGVNIKSGVLADVAFNIIYSPNTNCIKLSNNGEKTPQIYVKAYNNTFLNAGWRRPTIKGGSVWVEASARAEVVNNLYVNNRFGFKRDTKKPEDNRTFAANNSFYGFTQTCVDQFQPNKEIIAGTNDIVPKLAGENDPKFVNFPLNNPEMSPDFNTAWDFRVQTGSPVLGKGDASFAPLHTNGLVLNGKTYKSPAAANFIGAKGTN